jgi:Fe-S cluster biosynthesis and repair protein YggX
LITQQDIICLPLEDEEIRWVMQKAREQFAIAKRDNLRHRHINIQYDCILRGYIGEYAMRKWLEENDIILTETNFRNDDDNIDIDFLYKEKNIELKTSLVPDVDVCIEKSITTRDVKLIKRESKIEDLRGDIHIQIYFNQKRKAKDDWLQKQVLNIEEENIDMLFEKLLCKCYRNSIYFVGWIDKVSLIEKINLLPKSKQTWSFTNAKRDFWSCKIIDCKKPALLSNFLNFI